MAIGNITQVILTNLTSGAFSVGLSLPDGRRLDHRFPNNLSTWDVGQLATLADINMSPELQTMVDAGQLSVYMVSGADDVAGANAGIIRRVTLATDSQLTADVIGAATEAAHTALAAFTANELGVARRVIKFKARWHVDSSNGADTWTYRIRINGLATGLVLAAPAFDIVDDDEHVMEGTIMIRTVGATGTFNASCVYSVADSVSTAVGLISAATPPIIDTTGSNALTATSECSSANAGNQVTLREFWAELWEA